MLLIRALVTLEGIGASLDPEFNLAGYLQPFVEKLVKDRYQPRKMAERVFRDVRMLAGSLHDLPVHLGKTLKKLANDDLQVHLDHRGLDYLILELERASNRLVVGMVVAALILASAILIPAGTNTFWVSVPIYLLSSLLAMWLVYGIFRSGRL
jgi:ubiquinone biosynthesis protein